MECDARADQDGDEEDLEEYEVVAAIRALLLGRTVGKNPEDASEVSDGEEDTARQGSQSETTEARLARTNQCAKNVSCVRGYKHGSGPCKIRDRVQATEEANAAALALPPQWPPAMDASRRRAQERRRMARGAEEENGALGPGTVLSTRSPEGACHRIRP